MGKISHNPYFNRWFSAITEFSDESYIDTEVTILILIDGFLQLVAGITSITNMCKSQSLF